MNLTLFDDYITLQQALKSAGIIESGGAVKVLLQEVDVLVNGEKEHRRGRKLYAEDRVAIPSTGIEFALVSPSQEEIVNHQKETAEKRQIAKQIKELNNSTKKNEHHSPDRPVRFPGT